MKFGLQEQTIQKIHSVLSNYPQVKKAIIYGSRAKGDYKHGSDIDLTLCGGSDLNLKVLYGIMEEIDDLFLPYSFDISISHQIADPDVLGHIQRVGQTFYERTSSMKTIGLIGGTSWESSLEYYRLLNEFTKKRLGGLHSAKILMYSLDFGPVEQAMRTGDWESVARELTHGAHCLEKGGADFFLLCSNTTHKCATEVAGSVQIPLLHIGRATGEEILRLGLNKAGLLGTRFVMQENFLRGYLESEFKLKILVPEPPEQEKINQVIFEELCLGTFNDTSRRFFQGCIEQLKDQGAQCVILGCTEIPMLIKAEDSVLPVIDTTSLHAAAAVDWALAGC